MAERAELQSGSAGALTRHPSDKDSPLFGEFRGHPGMGLAG